MDQVHRDADQPAGLYRSQTGKPAPLCQGIDLRGVPRRNDDRRVTLQHCFNRYRGCEIHEIAKDIPATTQRNDIADDMVRADSDERLRPDLVEHGYIAMMMRLLP